jgi:large subunit ribosomal protein L17
MRKGISFRKLGRGSAHRSAMMRNMAASLIEHERIVTTTAKAKVRPFGGTMILVAISLLLQQRYSSSPFSLSLCYLSLSHIYNCLSLYKTHQTIQRLAEKLITVAKKPDPIHARREINKVLYTDSAATKLLTVLAPRYALRQGGYTRVLKLSQKRAGDNSDMSLIEYVDRPGEVRAARPPALLQTEKDITAIMKALGLNDGADNNHNNKNDDDDVGGTATTATADSSTTKKQRS